MKKYVIASFALLIGCSVAFGQKEFQKTFGGLKKENCYQVLPTEDNGFFALGSTETFGKGNSDIYLIRTDSVGDLLWAKAYGGPSEDFGTYMDKTKDGNYIIVGHSSSFSEEFNDVMLIKINKNGEVIWARSFGLDRSDYSTSVQCTSDGGFIILGETINFIGSEKNSDILVIKVDAKGLVEWSKVYGGNHTDYGYSIQQTKNGGYIIGGETNSYGNGDWDFYLLKINKNGDVEWGKAFGDKGIDYGRYAQECPDGGFVIGGNTSSFEAQEFDFCVVKTNANGGVEWSKMYGGNGLDYLLAMKVVPDKGIVFTGYSNSQKSVSEDVALVYLDFDGKTQWAKLYGSELHEYGVSLNYTPDKQNLIIGGSTNSFGTRGEDVLLIKTTLKKNSLPCNINFFYPFISKKVEIKEKSGHYGYDLHCEDKDITVVVTNTVTAEQIICNESILEE